MRRKLHDWTREPNSREPLWPGNAAYRNNGPHVQFGITTVLCEGTGQFTTKPQNLDSGVVLMKSIAEYYHDTRR